MTDRSLHPFRFGVQAAGGADRSSWTELARRVEGHGYDVLTMPDHFDDQLAPVPALMAVADATTRLRIGALVWDNDYRHPVVLGKELATLDVLSDGRLEVGLGAGWMRTDYDASGMAYDAAGIRVDRFVEGLAVLKGVFGDGPFSHAGQHYTITDYNGLPKPVQRPLPPFLIGGGGTRVLTIAAQEADIVGINPTLAGGRIDHGAMASAAAEAIDAKVAIVRAAAGERWAAIELHARTFLVTVTDDRVGAAAELAQLVGFTPEQILESPLALIGNAAQIADDLRARRERWGFSYITVGRAEVDAFAPVVAELSGS